MDILYGWFNVKVCVCFYFSHYFRLFTFCCCLFFRNKICVLFSIGNHKMNTKTPSNTYEMMIEGHTQWNKRENELPRYYLNDGYSACCRCFIRFVPIFVAIWQLFSSTSRRKTIFRFRYICCASKIRIEHKLNQDTHKECIKCTKTKRNCFYEHLTNPELVLLNAVVKCHLLLAHKNGITFLKIILINCVKCVVFKTLIIISWQWKFCAIFAGENGFLPRFILKYSSV